MSKSLREAKINWPTLEKHYIDDFGLITRENFSYFLQLVFNRGWRSHQNAITENITKRLELPLDMEW